MERTMNLFYPHLAQLSDTQLSGYYELSRQSLHAYKNGDNVKNQVKYNYLYVGYYAFQCGLKFNDIKKWIIRLHQLDENLKVILPDKLLAEKLYMSLQNLHKTYKYKDKDSGRYKMFQSFRIGALCDMYSVTPSELIVIYEKKESKFYQKYPAGKLIEK